jgi:hypothetical protein
MVQDVAADAMPALVERVKAAHTQYTRIPGIPRALLQTDTLPEQHHSPPATAASSSAAPEDKQPPMRVSQGRSAVGKLQQEVSRDSYDAHAMRRRNRLHGAMLRLWRMEDTEERRVGGDTHVITDSSDG